MTRACTSTVVCSWPATYKSRVSIPQSEFTSKECGRLGIRQVTRWRLLGFITDGWTLIIVFMTNQLVLPGRRSTGGPGRRSVDVVKQEMKFIYWWKTWLNGKWWGWEEDAEDGVARRQMIGCGEAIRGKAKGRFSYFYLICFSPLHCLVVCKTDFFDFYHWCEPLLLYNCKH